MKNVFLRKGRDEAVIQDEQGNVVCDIRVAGSSSTKNVNLSFRARDKNVKIWRRKLDS